MVRLFGWPEVVAEEPSRSRGGEWKTVVDWGSASLPAELYGFGILRDLHYHV